MLRSILAFSLFAAGIAIIGCDSGETNTTSNSSSTSSGSSIDAQDACAALASAVCGRIQSCSTFLFELQFGDLAQCETRIAATCPSTFDAEGSNATPVDTKTCADAFATVSCDGLYTRELPPGCDPPVGTLANGSPCGREVQCASAQCNTNGDLCGVCADPVPAGGSCKEAEECARGLVCAGMKCVAPGEENDTCDATTPCTISLACVNGTCAKPVGAGQTCIKDMLGDNCDKLQGLGCNMMNICQPIKMAAAGEPCGLQGMDFVACKAGGHCQLAPMMPTGTCLAPAADGAACNDMDGPKCLPESICSNGVCTLKYASSCN